jgi:glycolate oxidase
MMSKIGKDLSRILGKDKVYYDKISLDLYSRNAIYMRGNTDAVVFPESLNDVRRVVKYEYENGVKIYPQGSSSELVGSSIPSENSVILNFSKMNRIIETSFLDSYTIVEPGVRIIELNEFLEENGFFFPVDPASYKTATVGGAVNNGSGGMIGARYGTMKDWVLGLEVVLPDKNATVLQLGSKTLKNREGYDLVRLFVGSEGTLGIVTKAILKITPKPRYVAIVAGFFEKFVSLIDVVTEVKNRGYDVLMMEFIDEYSAKATVKSLDLDIDVYGHMLIVGVVGCKESLNRILGELSEIFRIKGAKKMYKARSIEEAEEKGIFEIRRGYHPAAIKIAAEERSSPRAKPLVFTEDISVPPSRLLDAISDIRRLSEEYGIEVSIAGHVSDGNIHPLIWSEEGRHDPEEINKLFEDIMKVALKYEGVISSEHGIGLLKKKMLRKAFEYRDSTKAVDLMREIKKIFDPKMILNPSKIFDL